jgi:hypothetical protein
METVMKILLILAVGASLSVAAHPALAAGGYDACVQEEQRLRASETEQCNGVGYLFNPSACFNTRKALLPYARGKCRDIAVAEGVMLPTLAPAKPVPVATPLPSVRGTTGSPVPPPEVSLPPVPPVTSTPPSELQQLRREVAELKADLERVKEELNRLKGGR